MSSTCLGQNWAPRYIEATIVKTNGDSLINLLQVYTYNNGKNVQPQSIVEKIRLVDEKGKRKEKIKAPDIRRISFVDFDSSKRVFLNNGPYLMEVLFDGQKIKWFRTFVRHGYDGSLMSQDYLLTEKEKHPFFGFLVSTRKKLLEVTASKPELAKEIETMKLTFRNVYNILNEYDQ